jgi:hypothetical protein
MPMQNYTSNSPFQEQSSTSRPVPGFTQNGPPGAKPGTPTKGPWNPDTHMLDTPSPTFSHTPSSPKTPGSPVTPINGTDPNPKIRGVNQLESPAFGVIERFHNTTHPLKTKMFAFAIPSAIQVVILNLDHLLSSKASNWLSHS